MATVEIIPIPLGSQLVKSIGANDKEDQNDFPVLFVFDGNITGLTEAGITLSAGATLVSLEGRNSVWKAMVRPSQTAGTVTVTVVANAVTEGNAQTSKDIEVVTNYPDTDAETPTLLFNHSNLTNASGLTVSPTRVIASQRWRHHCKCSVFYTRGRSADNRNAHAEHSRLLPSELSISMTRFL